MHYNNAKKERHRNDFWRGNHYSPSIWEGLKAIKKQKQTEVHHSKKTLFTGGTNSRQLSIFPGVDVQQFHPKVRQYINKWLQTSLKQRCRRGG